LAAVLASSPLHAGKASQAVTKALSDYEAAAKRAGDIEKRIRAEREALAAEIEALESERRELESAIIELEKQLAANDAKRAELSEENIAKVGAIRGVTASFVGAAGDLEALMRQSSLTALDPERLGRIEPLLQADHLTNPGDVTALGRLYLDEISFSGRVGVHKGSYIDGMGNEQTGEIVTLGKLTAIFAGAEETGFLLYSPATQEFSASSKRPSRGMQKRIREYVSGSVEAAPIDLTFGRELRRAAQEARLTVRTRKGGAVLLAVVIAALAALIIKRFDRQILRWTRGAGSGILKAAPHQSQWGGWALRPQSLAHRIAMGAIFLCGLGLYVRGVAVVARDDSDQGDVSLVSFVSLSPPPIAGHRVPRSMAPASRLAEYVPSKKLSREMAEQTDFQPDLVSPTITSPFAEGQADFDIAVDLSNLLEEEGKTGSDLVFESYELDQPPQAVVKIPPAYPHQARERGVEGAVQVRMLVHQDGSVGQVFIVDARPQGLFEEAVKKSLQQWRFNPGKIDGKTVTAWVVTTIHFDLN
jgi:TonB family protein